MRYLLLILLMLAAQTLRANPHDIESAQSPNKRFAISVRYVGTPDDFSKGARLFLRDATTGKIVQTLDLDTDDSNFHNDVSVDWSPSGRYVAVSTQLSQLRGFTIYRVANGRLASLTELPIPTRYKPEHRRSRGGPNFQQWIGDAAFKIYDNSCETEFSYRITKDRKLLATGSKLMNP